MRNRKSVYLCVWMGWSIGSVCRIERERAYMWRGRYFIEKRLLSTNPSSLKIGK